MRILPLLFAFAMLPLAAAAQSIAADLNGDGKPERFTLVNREGLVDLRIDDTGGAPVLAKAIVWSGGIGQKPEFARAPNGSVLLRSMNESIGRNRWNLTLTIAYRQGAYRVVGYTYKWYDTLDLANSGECDLNLLTGKGFVKKAEEAKKPVRTDLRAMPVTEVKDDHPIPEICGVK